MDALRSKDCAVLARDAKYGGNPEHKLSPGDYGLMPPARPRPGKTLCDGAVTKAEAERLLRSGLTKGMISEQCRGGWPQNVWAVSDQSEVFEAQLQNSELGIYHGDPMPIDDDLRKAILAQWARR